MLQTNPADILMKVAYVVNSLSQHLRYHKHAWVSELT
jgi:hypothetical protein